MKKGFYLDNSEDKTYDNCINKEMNFHNHVEEFGRSNVINLVMTTFNNNEYNDIISAALRRNRIEEKTKSNGKKKKREKQL